ncbi:DUF2169 domain-containing protein [Xanthomonas sp. AmX2]|nr:DUF2169 domain-containing protein [Xanthomonas sp.]MBN6151684.1 DUF2169 domain-containing protein [Xanthomonas sp.]
MHNWPQLAAMRSLRRYLRRCLVGRCFPFLPQDFDNRYFQAAPDDQQIPCLRGGEDVLLLNLTPRSARAFASPKWTCR